MSQKPWIAHYVKGCRAEVPSLPYKSLGDLFLAKSRECSSDVAFRQVMPNGMHASMTYQQTLERAHSFATWLREEAGVQEGDRVAIQMPNCLAYPIAVFGTLLAGGVLVNTNPLYTPTEMEHQFKDSGAKVLVIIDLFADRLPGILSKTSIEKVVVVKITEFFPALQGTIIRAVQKYVKKMIPDANFEHVTLPAILAKGHALSRGKDPGRYIKNVQASTLAALQYTGGTTGVSKGAMLTHGNLITNVLQMLEIAGDYLRDGEKILTALPLYHIFAFTVNLVAFYLKGGENILIPSPRPLTNLKKPFEKFGFTWMTGVNTLFNGLCNEDWFRANPPKMKMAVAGGMALQGAVAKRWQEITGTIVCEGYGLTETAPVLTFNPIGGKVKADTIGVPVPSTDLKLVDDNGNEVKQGEPGEILAKGPQVMQGYWQRKDETDKVMTSDGWLRTGDIGTMDEEGYFRIVDRKKDMVLVSGFNVYPNEVEERLATHPGVLECAVIGVKDEQSGEAVKAFVVKRPGHDSLSADEVVAHCRKSMTGYKVPKHVEFRAELPKSPVGKILRKELRPKA